MDTSEIRAGYAQHGLDDAVRDRVMSDAEALLAGSLAFYGGGVRRVGWPPAWRRFPDGTAGPPLVHWTRTSDDLPGDVKDLWEPSRFGFTFLLARAHALSGEARWAEAWWQAVEDWARHNPPNTGVNWRCGQEASLRGIAWCVGLSVFGSHPSSTPERIDLVRRMLEATVQRVRPTVGYALSQRNNHAVSELVFLLAMGPDSRLEALLREALRDQWYDDGSYSQQSLNYERLAVHGLVWLLHVQPNLRPDTIGAIRSCLARAAVFLRRCSDPVAQTLPNSGANDGALLLDLDVTPRWDVRPTLDLLGAGDRPTESGVWFPSDRLQLAAAPELTSSTTFITMQGSRSLLLTHVGPSRHRQGEDDQQSVELIIDGRPLLLDPGSYRYSGVDPWRQPFVGAAAHNAPHVPGATRSAVGRFLREPTPSARVVKHWEDDGLEVLVTARPLGAGVAHRAVIRRSDDFAVLDRVMGTAATVRWLIDPSRVDMVVIAAARGAREVERADDDPLSGWWAPLYGERRPAAAVVVELGEGESTLLRAAPQGAEGLGWQEIRAAVGGHPHLVAAAEALLAGSVGQP